MEKIMNSLGRIFLLSTVVGVLLGGLRVLWVGLVLLNLFQAETAKSFWGDTAGLMVFGFCLTFAIETIRCVWQYFHGK